MTSRVWDLPTRLFHWSLVILLGLSWWAAETGRDSIHLWSGYVLLFGLLFRLMWGLVGSSTARFSSFVRGPAAVLRYLRSGWRAPLVGHSPLGALSVIAMLALLVLQVGLGLVATDEDGLMTGPLAMTVSMDASETARDLHDLNFDVLRIVIALHIAAVLFYWLFLKKPLIVPMITGRATLDAASPPMQPAPVRRAVLCAAVALAVTAWIIAGAPPF